MSESLIYMIITVISGVMVFSLGQLFFEFVLRPIQEGIYQSTASLTV